MKITYQETTLKDVLNYFVDGFEFKQNIHKTEYIVDPTRGIVLFKFFINDEKEQP